MIDAGKACADFHDKTVRNVSGKHVQADEIWSFCYGRFTRLTNGHSKKIDNHCHMVALYTVWHNFARINSAVRMAPAMAASLSTRLWSMKDIVALIDAAMPPR